ncbi:MAG: homoaconitase [Calditrichaeota bacterium]|nr:MAG: homoaconitase [Calditrichota bacterium]MBL1206850.1 homoaconitase [Calditrichota bacterium]NOG46677.1 homoaconitase [Calditrichota bacterium]
MAQNLIEKITQKYCLNLSAGQKVKSGEFVTIQPAHVMTHDNSAAVIPKFKNIGAKKVANPRQIVFTLDHNVQDTSEKNLTKYKNIERFADDMNIDFYPAGRGIGHQVMCEEGYAWPGSFVVASDSHSNMYGGLGCLGTPIVRSDAAAVWATGKTWWQIPKVAKVTLTGHLQKGVTGKDVIITLAGFFNNDEVLNHALEFSGEGVKDLSVDQRLTIANMSTEWGALAAVFPIDEVTIKWLQNRNNLLNKDKSHLRINDESIKKLQESAPVADEDAFYQSEITLDLATVVPHVSGPNSVKKMVSVSDIAKEEIGIQKAYLVSCVNSRVEDLAQAAEIVKGKKVADGVEFYIAAASNEVQAFSEQRNDWQTLLDCGAIPLPPGCGPCIGLGKGLLEEGEVGISATNRNFKGRMGHPTAQAYLASPAVVAASAIAGTISEPNSFVDIKIDAAISENDKTSDKAAVQILDGFPELFMGRALFCPSDNINTDGIYPGKYTYREDLTPEMMAEVAMENYDPDFQKIAKKGDLILSGFNFGTGSSREQAATALKHFGIQMVIAGSFSETYKRNAINNGFILVECPELIKDLYSKYGNSFLTKALENEISVSMKQSEIAYAGKQYSFNALGPIAQELILEDGLENWVKKSL